MSLRDYERGTGHQRSSSGRSPTRGVWALGFVIVALIGTAVSLSWKAKSVAVATDPTTLCPLDRPPSELLVLLLDASDRLSEPQRLEIRNELARLRNTIGRFGQVDVYAVGQVMDSVAESIVRLCNPGTGEDLNSLYQNPQLAKRRWDSFAVTLDAVIDSQVSAASLRVSPIFEAIQATALRSFGQPEYDGLPKRLILVSDLLQHVPGQLSMYDSLPNYESFKASPYFVQVRADLSDVSVVILYLARSSRSVQGRDHVAFWDTYFSDQGASINAVRRVFGDRSESTSLRERSRR